MTRTAATAFALLALAAGCRDEDGDGRSALWGDCDDTRADVYPGADEHCDGLDEDCDGVADEEAVDAPVWHLDADLDGYGGNLVALEACEAPGERWLASGEDCDDLDPEVAPLFRFYEDKDGDGWGGDEWVEPPDCVKPSDHAWWTGDCDDTDPGLHPATRWYSDVDGDGYGSALHVAVGCEEVEGHVQDVSDCDDLDASVHPGAVEVCGGGDEDCDGLVDDDDPDVDPDSLTAWYRDEDGDGYAGWEEWYCEPPPGHVAEATDCDEENPDVNPGEEEVCGDGVDNDCSGDGTGCRWDRPYDLADADFVHTGPADAEDVGAALAVADLDGDGADEVVVSGWWFGEEYTREECYGWGWTWTVTVTDEVGVVWVLSEPGSGDLDLEEDAAATWYAESQTTGGGDWAMVGRELTSVGDLDGDGTAEVAVSIADEGTSDTCTGGSVCGDGAPSVLVYGDTDLLADDLSVWDASDIIPGSPDAAGDLDGDGYGESLFSGPCGNLLVYGSTVPLAGGWSILSPPDDAVLFPSSSLWCTGASAAGDLDGDGLDDLAGDGCAGDYPGPVWLLHGDATRFSGTYDLGVDADATLESASDGSLFGERVGGGADLTGDGYDDLVATLGGDSALVFSGGATRLSGALWAEYLAFASITSGAATGTLGQDMVFADLDADGTGDALLSDGETVWVVYGPVDPGPHALEDLPWASFSGTTLGAWDVGTLDEDADAYPDLIFGVPDDGALYLFVGSGM